MSKMKRIPNFLKTHLKENCLSDLCIVGMTLIVALHILYVPRTNSYLFGYEKESELLMFEGRTNFDISKYCKNNICKLNETDAHIKFINKDYRKIRYLENNAIYVNEEVNVTTLPKELRIIQDDLDWHKIETESDGQNLCKRCLSGSNPQYQRCSTLSLEGWNIRDCQG